MDLVRSGVLNEVLGRPPRQITVLSLRRWLAASL